MTLLRDRSVRRWAAAGFAAGMVVLTSGAVAQPQDGQTPATPQLRPPTPGKPDDPPVIMNYLSLVVIIAAVVGANLIPSKRGHQD